MGIPFRFIQCGDLHLGAPFRYMQSMSHTTIGDAMVRSTFTAFDNIVQLAVQERVDAVLITGDSYNGEERNLEAQGRFVKGCERLAQAQIPVYMIHGNHDKKDKWGAHMRLPNNVYIFGSQQVERKSLVVRGQEVAGIYGISLTSYNQFQDYSCDIQPLERDGFSIGLFHGTVGAQEGQEVTGPMQLSTLVSRGISYWALGHIHKRQVLHEYPHVVYAGNSQGLHKKEEGPKGCYLVQVTSTGHVELTFKETNAIRFEEAVIDISGLQTTVELEEMIRHKKEMLRKQKKSMLLRIRLEGEGPLHDQCREEELRQLWVKDAQEDERGSHAIVVYDVEDYTKAPIQVEGRLQEAGMIGDYLRAHHGWDSLATEKKQQVLRDAIRQRGEVKRLGVYQQYLTDELLERAFHRAKEEGVRLLTGGIHED